MPLPQTYTAPNDLTDAEFAELDDLLVDAPDRLLLGDAVMLDGYLCGVQVQPRMIAQEEWSSRIFELTPAEDAEDEEGPGPQIDDPEWVASVMPLIVRRYAALNRKIVEEGSFDPFILEVDDDTQFDAGNDPEPEAEADDALANLNPISQALAPWVFGFQLACVHYEGLLDTSDDAIMLALARLFRHLPPADTQMADLVETMDKESPIETIDEALDELVSCVIEISDLTSDDRYRVETVKRETPKVGRNDPCPCGSGKKFKQCHGAAA